MSLFYNREHLELLPPSGDLLFTLQNASPFLNLADFIRANLRHPYASVTSCLSYGSLRISVQILFLAPVVQSVRDLAKDTGLCLMN